MDLDILAEKPMGRLLNIQILGSSPDTHEAESQAPRYPPAPTGRAGPVHLTLALKVLYNQGKILS